MIMKVGEELTIDDVQRLCLNKASTTMHWCTALGIETFGISHVTLIN